LIEREHAMSSSWDDFVIQRNRVLPRPMRFIVLCVGLAMAFAMGVVFQTEMSTDVFLRAENKLPQYAFGMAFATVGLCAFFYCCVGMYMLWCYHKGYFKKS
jgi:multisubunit Na+/H+ antiporter MnhB subunit